MLQRKVALLSATTSAIIKKFCELAIKEVVDAGNVNVVVLPDLHADVADTHKAHFTEGFLVDRPTRNIVAHGVGIGLLARTKDLIELPAGEIDIAISKVKYMTVDSPPLADDC